jgi:hypothetical protein
MTVTAAFNRICHSPPPSGRCGDFYRRWRSSRRATVTVTRATGVTGLGLGAGSVGRTWPAWSPRARSSSPDSNHPARGLRPDAFQVGPGPVRGPVGPAVRAAFALDCKTDRGTSVIPGDCRASQLGGMSNFDCAAAVPLSDTSIVEAARLLRIQFEPRQDSGRLLGSTRSRSLPRFHDRWDCGGRIGDRCLGVVVEGTQ